MTRDKHVCPWCKAEYTSPLAAALCCDEVSLSMHDDRLDKPRYERGYD